MIGVELQRWNAEAHNGTYRGIRHFTAPGGRVSDIKNQGGNSVETVLTFKCSKSDDHFDLKVQEAQQEIFENTPQSRTDYQSISTPGILGTFWFLSFSRLNPKHLFVCIVLFFHQVFEMGKIRLLPLKSWSMTVLPSLLKKITTIERDILISTIGTQWNVYDSNVYHLQQIETQRD